jgi:hypothetical protein
LSKLQPRQVEELPGDYDPVKDAEDEVWRKKNEEAQWLYATKKRMQPELTLKEKKVRKKTSKKRRGTLQDT